MNDDLDDDNIGDDLGGEGFDDPSFDDFEGQDNTLGDLWRNNPMVKIGVIFAAGAAIFGTIILFGGKDEQLNRSYVSGGSDVSTVPGTEEATQTYVEAVQEFNETEVEIAIATGGSALPVPIEPPKGSLALPDEDEEEEDPLQRWRRLQEERLQREVQQRETVDPTPIADTGQGEAIMALAELMAQQMSAILESQVEAELTYKTMTGPDWLEKLAEEEEAAAAEAAEDGAEGRIVENIIIPAGTIEYGQLLIQANTDSPGPILAQIVSGPLAGSRLLGSFEEQNELITLSFDTAIIDGVSHSVDAVAIDPDTTLSGMATDVDHHYFQRVILPMAAAFVEGATDAISNAGLTTVTVEGGSAVETTSDADTKEEISSGIQEAGQELRDILDDAANDIEVTVIIDAGTPLGILFLEPVTDGDPKDEDET